MPRAAVLLAALAATAVAAPGQARAEKLAISEVLQRRVDEMTQQVQQRLDMVSIGDACAGSLYGVGPDADLDVLVDVRARRARIRLGGGDDRFVSLQLDARLRFDRGLPRLKGQLDLGLVGQRVSINLPEITVRPRTWQGEVYLEYNIPIIEGRF